ncbi:MAG: hypothetical protein FWG98_08865 [Candidatus Cloacimonetes bacterium]|nr:hypothetical protein [Candidatus Cloacimonadota bacterium]
MINFYFQCKKIVVFTILIAIVMSMLPSCATIFTGTSKNVLIDSSPQGTDFTIYDRRNRVVSTGQTPHTVRLKKGAGYFSGANYRISYERPGYQNSNAQITTSLGGWYWANLLTIYSIPLGMLIIDPLTGGMWQLSSTNIHRTLTHELGVSGVIARNTQPIESSSPPPTGAVDIERAIERAVNDAFADVRPRSRIAIVQISIPDRNMRNFVNGELEHILRQHDFRVVDRAQMDLILEEQTRQLGGDFDDRTAVSIGRLAGADFIVTGSVDGEGSLRRLRIRVLNVETSVVVGTASERF